MPSNPACAHGQWESHKKQGLPSPYARSWLSGGFSSYQTRLFLWAMEQTEARGLEQRVWQSPNSLNIALVCTASSLFPSRWTYEEEMVADTTENFVWWRRQL